jgi:hypothetical protein
MINVRNHFRLRKQVDVYWKADEHKLANKGKILDISITGMKFAITTTTSMKAGTLMFLECADIPALPKHAKLKWCRALPGTKNLVCGVSFIKENSDYAPGWKAWMEANMAKLADVSNPKILGKFLDFAE